MSYQERGPLASAFLGVTRPSTEGSALPDIGWTTATMRLGIADATLTATTNEIAYGYRGQRDGRHQGWHAGNHYVRKRWSGLEGTGGLAI